MKTILSLFILILFTIPNAHANAHHPNHSFYLINIDNGQIIDDENSDKKIYIASITKLMTLDIILSELESGILKKTDMITISKDASHQPESHLGLKAGSKISVDDAIKAVTVHSSNDIAYALAEHIMANTDTFVMLMNYQAKNYGMNHTQFFNPTGLPGDDDEHTNYSTDKDLALLYRHIIQSHKDNLAYFSIPEWSYKGRDYYNTNHLVGAFQGLYFSKTGYIDLSGYNLIIAVERYGIQYLAIISGCNTVSERDYVISSKLKKAFKIT